MKTIVFLICIALVFTSCSPSGSSSQTISSEGKGCEGCSGHSSCEEGKEKTVEPTIPDKPIPGGYVLQDPNTEEMKKIAAQVASLFQKEHEDYSLVKAHKVATQVVAGVNYFLRLEFKTKQENAIWDAIVFQALDQSMSITKKEQIK